MSNKSIFEVRIENLNKLIAHYGSVRAFERVSGIAASMVSRVTHWTPDNTNPNYKRMGERLARKTEINVGLPAGWLDTTHESGADPDLLSALPQPPLESARGLDSIPAQLSSIQTATRDTMVKLMVAGKLPDSVCLKLLQTWQGALEELESLPS